MRARAGLAHKVVLCDEVNVTPDQADVLQFKIGQVRQRLAGRAAVLPIFDRREERAEKIRVTAEVEP